MVVVTGWDHLPKQLLLPSSNRCDLRESPDAAVAMASNTVVTPPASDDSHTI